VVRRAGKNGFERMLSYTKAGAACNSIVVNHALYYGNAHTALARVVPDALWRGMWRIAWPDGQVSDIVNLARARDAAAAFAERGPPARNRRRLHWKQGRSKTPPGAPLIAQREVPCRAGRP
jgi:hypothetical protein